MKSLISVLFCVFLFSCQNEPSEAKTLQSQIVTNSVILDTIPTKVDSPTQFDHPQLLGEWVVSDVIATTKATQKHYLKAQVSLGNDQRFKLTTSNKEVQVGFWKANAKGTKMRWIIKDMGMVKLDVEKIEAKEVVLRIYSAKDLDTQLVLSNETK